MFVESRIRDVGASGVPEMIGAGSRVTLEDLNDEEAWEVMIVTSAQADPAVGRISEECPIGEALLGRSAGDTIRVEVPLGTVEYRVVSVSRANSEVSGSGTGQPQLPARSYWDEP